MHFMYQLSATLTVRTFFPFGRNVSTSQYTFLVGVSKKRKISSETWPEIKGVAFVKHYNFSEALMM